MEERDEPGSKEKLIRSVFCYFSKKPEITASDNLRFSWRVGLLIPVSMQFAFRSTISSHVHAMFSRQECNEKNVIFILTDTVLQCRYLFYQEPITYRRRCTFFRYVRRILRQPSHRYRAADRAGTSSLPSPASKGNTSDQHGRKFKSQGGDGEDSP